MATRKRRSIARRRETRRDFLLFPTDIRKVEVPSLVAAEPQRQLLAASFPELLCAAEFQRSAFEKISAAERFAVVVLRPDEAAMPEGDEAERETLPLIASCLEESCRGFAGIWGLAEFGLLAGYWPTHSAADALSAASRLQDQVRERTGRTVTVGVAAYPTLDYPPQAMLENARKALNHAQFFGSNSRIVFDAVSLNISGDKYFDHGDLPAARHEFEQALRLDPENVNVLNSLGVCQAALGEWENALKAFSAVLNLKPDEHMAVYNIGLVHLLQNRKPEALEQFHKALTLRPDVFEILYQAGILELDLNRPEEACPLLEHAARLRSRSASVQRWLGDCYARLGLAEKAIGSYRKAVKANPRDAAALSALGGLLDEKGENPEIALIFCREGAKLAPENALFRLRLARLYLRLERLPEALAEFEQAGRLGHDASGDIERVRALLEPRN